MRPSTLFIIAKIFGQEYYNCNLSMKYTPSLKIKKQLRNSEIGSPRTLDRRVKIYASKRRNTTRR